MPQTIQYPVQMEPTEMTLEHVIYLIATSVLLATSVPCQTAVSGATSVQMEHFAPLEDLHPQFACQGTTADKPKLKCHAQLVFTVQMVLLHIFLVLRGTTATQPIDVTVTTRMRVPASQRYVH